MNVELSNKTINEISPETLVEWYNLTQYSLQTIQNKLKNTNDSVWLQISQMALSDNFIGEFQDFIDWEAVSQYQTLSEQLIRDLQDKVNWGLISMKPNLSEDFIREFRNRVAWVLVSSHELFLKVLLKSFKIKFISLGCA